MSLARLKTNHGRREKLFGAGRPRAMDRNLKVRLMVQARALMRRVEKHKHYGAVTAKTYAVLEALLWGFHNAKSGLCFPGYDAIAARAGCARSTVHLAIHRLEATGMMTWVHRLKRENGRVLRASNGYRFDPSFTAPVVPPPTPSRAPRRNVVSVDFTTKSEIKPRTAIQDSFPFGKEARRDGGSKITVSEGLMRHLLDIKKGRSDDA